VQFEAEEAAHVADAAVDPGGVRAVRISGAIQQALVGGVALAGADRLIVRHKVSIINCCPISYKARMERIPGVDLATHQTWFGGIYQDPKNFFMQNPVVPEKFLAMHPE
jgi:putative ABC transport system permease protein